MRFWEFISNNLAEILSMIGAILSLSLVISTIIMSWNIRIARKKRAHWIKTVREGDKCKVMYPCNMKLDGCSVIVNMEGDIATVQHKFDKKWLAPPDDYDR